MNSGHPFSTTSTENGGVHFPLENDGEENAGQKVRPSTELVY